MNTDDPFRPDYLTKLGSRKSDLIAKLNDLHKALSDLSQDETERPQTLQDIANQLVSPKILGNNDRDIRLLSSCCIVDILRVYAPDAPYSDDIMVDVFEAIIALLRGLATHDSESATGQKLFYILHSLATVRSCVVPVILQRNAVRGADHLVQSLFEALISSIRPQHSSSVLNHMAVILEECIEECDDIDQELLDLLLIPLLPTSKADNPIACEFVTQVLKAVVPIVQSPISSIINRILIGSDAVATRDSELSEYIYSLIYELQFVSPSLLLKILPNVAVQLLVEDQEVRHKAVKLLGELFSSPHADFASDYPRNFKDFIGRAQDMSAEIRSEFLDKAAAVMLHQPNTRKLLEDAVCSRLCDENVDNRHKAIKILLDMAVDDPLQLQPETFVKIGDRISDRKTEIRTAAITGLARVYHRHVASALPALAADLDAEQLFASVRSLQSRLGFIPGRIFQAWVYPEYETKHLIVKCLQEYILPRSLREKKTQPAGAVTSILDTEDSADQDEALGLAQQEQDNGADRSRLEDNQLDRDGCRAAALLVMFQWLDSSSRDHFNNILAFKIKVRLEVLSFLNSRPKSSLNNNSHTETSVSSSQAVEDKCTVVMKRSMLRLIGLVPTSDHKVVLLEKLHGMRDRKICNVLHSACASSRDGADELCAAGADMRARLGSRTALGQYVGSLFDFAANMIVSEGMITALINYLNGEDMPESVQSTLCGLLLVLSKYCALAFISSAGQLEHWLSRSSVAASALREAEEEEEEEEDTHSNYVQTCLSVIEKVAPTWAALASVTGHTLSKQSGSRTSEHAQHDAVQSLCQVLLQLAVTEQLPPLCERYAQIGGFIAVCVFSLDNTAVTPTVSASTARKKSPSSSASVSTVMKQLLLSFTEHDKLSLGSDGLLRNLHVLSALVQSQGAASASALPGAWVKKSPAQAFLWDDYDDFRTAVVQFLQNELLVDTNDSVDVDELNAGIRIWCRLVVAEAEYKQSLRSDDIEMPEVEDEVVTLAGLVFTALNNQGKTFAGYEFDDNETQMKIYENCAANGFYLLQLPGISEVLNPVQWMDLGWTLLRAPEVTRQRLFETFTTIAKTIHLHPKFLAYICLMANDALFKDSAEGVLTFVLKRLRRTHQELCGRAKNEQEVRDMSYFMPESLVPYVLYLLSYHPEFPESCTMETSQDKDRFGIIVKNIKLMYRVLMNTIDEHSDNLPYLLKQANLILRMYEDIADPMNIGIRFVARISIILLSVAAKTAENLQPYDWEIELPADLYCRRKDPTAATGLEEAEDDIQTSLEHIGTRISAAGHQHHGGGGGGGGAGRKGSSPSAAVKAQSRARGAAAARPRKAAPKKQVVHSEEESDQDEGVGDENDNRPDGAAPQQPHKAQAHKPQHSEQEAPQRQSSRLQRGTGRHAVSYVEQEVDEREVQKWHELAGRKRLSEDIVPRTSLSNGGDKPKKRTSAADGHNGVGRHSVQSSAKAQSPASGEDEDDEDKNDAHHDSNRNHKYPVASSDPFEFSAATGQSKPKTRKLPVTSTTATASASKKQGQAAQKTKKTLSELWSPGH